LHYKKLWENNRFGSRTRSIVFGWLTAAQQRSLN
jgi:hypothetical protein